MIKVNIKKQRVNENVVATLNHREYEHVLLNNKFLRDSMNRIESKDHKIVLNNGYDSLALVY